MPRRSSRVFHREGFGGRPLAGAIAEGMTLGIIACVALLAGWNALPGPDPSRHSRMILLAAAVLAGAAIAAVWRARGPRGPWTHAGHDRGQDPRA